MALEKLDMSEQLEKIGLELKTEPEKNAQRNARKKKKTEPKQQEEEKKQTKTRKKVRVRVKKKVRIKVKRKKIRQKPDIKEAPKPPSKIDNLEKSKESSATTKKASKKPGAKIPKNANQIRMHLEQSGRVANTTNKQSPLSNPISAKKLRKKTLDR